MPKPTFSLAVLLIGTAAGPMLCAGPVENTWTLGGYCSLYTFAKADHIREAPHPCLNVLTFHQPSDAGFRSGRRPTLRITVPGAPAALLEFHSAIPSRSEFGAGELAFQFINGARTPGKCKIQSKDWGPGLEGLELVCTANRSGFQEGRFAFAFTIGEVPIKPGESTKRTFLLATGTIFDQFQSSIAPSSAMTLRGACKYTQNATTIPCAATASLVVPAFAQLIQGRRPELHFQPTGKGLSEIVFELGPGGAAATGGHGFAVDSVNGDTRVDSDAQCAFDLPFSNPRTARIECRATTQALGGHKTQHDTRFDITASAAEIEAINAHVDRAADAAGNPMISTSRDRLSVFGILPGKPLPAGIGNCSGDLESARLSYCFFQRPELSHLIRLANFEDPVGPEYRWVDLQINPKVLDPFVSGSILEILIDPQDAVQRIRITTLTSEWAADLEALKRKYGTPAQESWPEKLDFAANAKIPMPEATWKTGGMTITFNAAPPRMNMPGIRQTGVLTISADSMLRATEQRNRTPAPATKRPQ